MNFGRRMPYHYTKRLCVETASSKFFTSCVIAIARPEVFKKINCCNKQYMVCVKSKSIEIVHVLLTNNFFFFVDEFNLLNRFLLNLPNTA